MQRLGRFFWGARFLGGGRRGDRVDLLLCAGVWWLPFHQCPLVRWCSRGFSTPTWGFVDPLCASLLFLSFGTPCSVFTVVFLPPHSIFGGWCCPGGCSRSGVSLPGLAAVQPCLSFQPFSLSGSRWTVSKVGWDGQAAGMGWMPAGLELDGHSNPVGRWSWQESFALAMSTFTPACAAPPSPSSLLLVQAGKPPLLRSVYQESCCLLSCKPSPAPSLWVLSSGRGCFPFQPDLSQSCHPWSCPRATPSIDPGAPKALLGALCSVTGGEECP